MTIRPDVPNRARRKVRRSRSGWIAALLLALALALPSRASAATGAADRPSVGLVLAGGGAKGIAHVGVLQWLEEHRVPVDFVAGTSMGGLVGGSYATGMSAAEVRALLKGVDWSELFVGDVPFRLKAFRRKEDRRSYPVRLELGLRHGVSLASGIDSGHMVGLLLSRIAFPYSSLDDFDALPIPFRCVATDIVDAEQVVMGDGSLAQALRATMAIPGVFPPVIRDGRQLVDGGVLNNLPVDVVRAMGADVVIAVNLRVPKPKRALSMIGLAGRALDVMIAETSLRNLDLADVVVDVDVEGYDTTDWREVDALTERGYAAAEAQAEALGKLALDEAGWRAHLEARQARRRLPMKEPAFAEVTGVSEEFVESVESHLRERYVGHPLDVPQLEDDLSLLVGTGRYESALYEAAEGDGGEGLRVRAQEKTYAPPFVNFSVDVRTRSDELVFNFGTRMTALDVVGPGSDWRVDAAAGSTIGLSSELLVPLFGSGLGLAPRVNVNRTTTDVFNEDVQVATFRSIRAGGGLDLRASAGRNAELRLGWALSHVDIEPRVGDPGLPAVSGPEGRFEARWTLDTQDSATIPSRGVRVSATGRYYHRVPEAGPEDDATFPLAAGTLVAAWPMGSRSRALLDVRGGTSFRSHPPVSNAFTLGGPFRLGAFEEDEFRGRHFGYASVAWLREIRRLPDFVGGGVFLYVGGEAGTAFDRFEADRIVADGVLGLTLDTAFGPIFVGGAVGSAGRGKFFFSVGAPFPFRPPLDLDSPVR